MENDTDTTPTPAKVGHLYLSPIRKSGDQINDLDDEGQRWGFYEYAELLLRVGDVAHAKELDTAATRHLVLKWGKAGPYPHYRVTRMRFLALRNAGAEVVSEEVSEQIRNSWR